MFYYMDTIRESNEAMISILKQMDETSKCKAKSWSFKNHMGIISVYVMSANTGNRDK